MRWIIYTVTRKCKMFCLQIDKVWHFRWTNQNRGKKRRNKHFTISQPRSTTFWQLQFTVQLPRVMSNFIWNYLEPCALSIKLAKKSISVNEKNEKSNPSNIFFSSKRCTSGLYQLCTMTSKEIVLEFKVRDCWFALLIL